MIDTTRSSSTDLADTFVASLEAGLELHYVNIDWLVEQELNAHVMNGGTFDRLAANIEKDRRLESLPFCAAREKGEKTILEIVSGHHRVRAARKAELQKIHVLVDVTGLSRSEIVSKQLSHNAIGGVDDPDILAQLFQEMTTIEDMVSSHIDPFEIGVYPATEVPKLDTVKVNYETRVVTFMFLPTQADQFDEVCDRIPQSVDDVALLPLDLVSKFEETMQQLGKRCDIRAMGAVVSKMCDLALEWIEEHPEEEKAEEERKAKTPAAKKAGTPNANKPRPPRSLIEAYERAKAAEKQAEEQPVSEDSAAPEVAPTE